MTAESTLEMFLFYVYLYRLPIGYVFLPNGHMDPVSWCDFEFYKLGDDGNPPSEFTMNFIAGNIWIIIHALTGYQLVVSLSSKQIWC